MLKTPENIRELQRKLYRKAKQEVGAPEAGIRFSFLPAYQIGHGRQTKR